MKDCNCIFCKIIEGSIPSSVVYEDNDFRAILDIAPSHKGHTIVLPKYHAANIFELPEDVAAKALPVVKKVAAAIEDETGCDGVNILQNNGVAAGQTVFHLHIHIIPRFEGDGILPVWPQGSYEKGEAAILAEKIKNRIS
ncbi:MAG: HIT family protein [Lachnospiraceae bacterium]|nr:HIT family protein [Lachnospiraceae bacterium]